MIYYTVKNQPLHNQMGQSMTQYLILLFMLAIGALVTVGHGSQAARYQIAGVSHEISGNSAEAKKSIEKAQQQARYASASASPSNDPNNPVTNPSTGTSSTGTPSTGTPSTGTPSTGTPSTGTPSTGTPSTGTPSTGTPSTGTPSTGTPSTGTPGTVITPPVVVKCTKPTPKEDDGSTKTDEDKGFWGSLWNEIKTGLTDGYEFVKGFWEGMKKQVADLGNLLAHPIETAKGLIALGKQFVKNPVETAKMIADSLGEEFRTLVECGAFDKGRIIGENVSPAFMVKLASKMAKFGDLATALKKTKKDFGCASFVAGTPIWTPDGKVNIETLQKGNLVLSRDRKTYADKAQAIQKTFGRIAPDYYHLSTEFGTIDVTAEHPMWKQGIGWTEAQYLKVDDVVASAEGDVLILDNQKVDKPVRVYNFSVENTPSYFAGAGGLWVHNSACEFEIIDGVRHVVTKIDSYNGKNKVLNNPLPSTVYKVNGRHTYKTDKYGRPESVQSTVELKDLDTTARNYYRQCKVGKCGIEGDEGGHLIATKLGGPGEVINLVPQNFNLNRGEWKKMENEWGRAAVAGKKVEIDIQLKYTGDNVRPDEFVVTYKIEGSPPVIKEFKNQPGG